MENKEIFLNEVFTSTLFIQLELVGKYKSELSKYYYIHNLQVSEYSLLMLYLEAMDIKNLYNFLLNPSSSKLELLLFKIKSDNLNLLFDKDNSIHNNIYNNLFTVSLNFLKSPTYGEYKAI